LPARRPTTGCAVPAPSTPGRWSYNIPARPGDLITLQARALDKFIKRERLFVVHDNVFFNQRGEVICSGRGWTIRPW
jgi:3-hydroxybutyryl-CoA dehydratase